MHRVAVSTGISSGGLRSITTVVGLLEVPRGDKTDTRVMGGIYLAFPPLRFNMYKISHSSKSVQYRKFFLFYNLLACYSAVSNTLHTKLTISGGPPPATSSVYILWCVWCAGEPAGAGVQRRAGHHLPLPRGRANVQVYSVRRNISYPLLSLQSGNCLGILTVNLKERHSYCIKRNNILFICNEGVQYTHPLLC
jgi:hypothetical protein